MKFLVLFFIVFFLVSCSGINVERKSTLQFEQLYVAKVKDRNNVIIDSNESKSGRIIVGLFSAGPIGAIATAQTEEGFSYPKAFEYTLDVNTNETKVVISRSIVDIGNCVKVVSPDSSAFKLLMIVNNENCQRN